MRSRWHADRPFGALWPEVRSPVGTSWVCLGAGERGCRVIEMIAIWDVGLVGTGLIVACRGGEGAVWHCE